MSASVASDLLAQLAAIQVILPLLAAPVCVIIGGGQRAWSVALVVSWGAFLTASGLLSQVLDQGVIRYELGGWAAPWGIEYRIDEINAFVLLIVSGVSSLALLFARTSVAREVAEDKRSLFYCAWMLCLTGLLGITITGDAFNVFVFLEISSLSTYVLVSLGSHRRALVSAFRYLILGTVGATFILIGVGLLYAMTGTLNMVDLAQRLPQVSHTRTVYAAFAFLAVGIGLKMALFPFHAWLPGAYAEAPSAVTAFLAGTSTKVAVYVLLRFFFTVFGASFAIPDAPCAHLHFHDVLDRGLSERHQAHAGVLQPCPDRIHGSRNIAGFRGRTDGGHRSPVQSRADEGRAVHVIGVCFLSRGIHIAGVAGRTGAAHAVDAGRLCRRRAEPGRRSHDCRLRQ
jgi:multicomponent Na+:H+ antiporter subunit D